VSKTSLPLHTSSLCLRITQTLRSLIKKISIRQWCIEAFRRNNIRHETSCKNITYCLLVFMAQVEFYEGEKWWRKPRIRGIRSGQIYGWIIYTYMYNVAMHVRYPPTTYPTLFLFFSRFIAHRPLTNRIQKVNHHWGRLGLIFIWQ